MTSLGRRPRLVAAVALVLLFAVVTILLARSRETEADRANDLASVVTRDSSGAIIAVKPPYVVGRQLLRFSNPAPSAPVRADGTVYSAVSEGAYDARGGGVSIGLRCIGSGIVRVDLSSDRSYPFRCSTAIRTLRTIDGRAHTDPFAVVVATTGPVRWGVTITVVAAGSGSTSVR